MNPTDETRRLRVVTGDSGIVVQPVENLPKRAADLIPDYALLQQERYQYLPLEARDVAEARDKDHPLWSVVHAYKPPWKKGSGPSWQVDWDNVKRFYLFSEITMKDLAELADVPLRTMEHQAALHKWTQAKREYASLRAAELAAPSLAEMEVEARKTMVENTLMEWGLELGQRAMAALANVDVTKVKARDLPLMMATARDFMTLANKMPSMYKHSQTKVERTDQTSVPVINILNMPPSEAAEKAKELLERMKVLEAAQPVPIAPASNEPRTP